MAGFYRAAGEEAGSGDGTARTTLAEDSAPVVTTLSGDREPGVRYVRVPPRPRLPVDTEYEPRGPAQELYALGIPLR
jgi:hypothetical protein